MAGILLRCRIQTGKKTAADKSFLYSCRHCRRFDGGVFAVNIGMGDETAGEFYSDDDTFCHVEYTVQILSEICVG